MARQFCDDCDRRIPERAPWCPACGVRRRAGDPPGEPDPLTWRQPRRRRVWPWDRLAPLAILCVLVGSVMVAGFQSRSRSLARQVTDALSVAFSLPGFGTPQTVTLEAEPATADAGCSFLRALLGTCVQVRCTVTNSGNTAGIAVVTATVETPAQTLTRTRELLLTPGQREQVTFSFREARGSSRFRARCAVDREGS